MGNKESNHRTATQEVISKSTYLFSVPSDVIQNRLMHFLARSDLVILSMTCKAMQKIFIKWKLDTSQKKMTKGQFQGKLIEDLFRGGSFSQVLWFQKTLKYLLLTELDREKQILLAATGDHFFRVYISVVPNSHSV